MGRGRKKKSTYIWQEKVESWWQWDWQWHKYQKRPSPTLENIQLDVVVEWMRRMSKKDKWAEVPLGNNQGMIKTRLVNLSDLRKQSLMHIAGEGWGWYTQLGAGLRLAHTAEGRAKTGTHSGARTKAGSHSRGKAKAVAHSGAGRGWCARLYNTLAAGT